MKNQKVKLLLYIVALTVVCGCAKTASTSTELQLSTGDEASGDAYIADVDTEADTDKGTDEQADDKSALSGNADYEEILKGAMSSKDGDILQIFEEDYDGDGSMEAYAFTGIYNGDSEWDTYNGRIWYVNNEAAVPVTEEAMSVSSPGQVIQFGKRKYYTVYEMYATARVSYVYTVRDGEYSEENISRIGDMVVSDSNNCTISVSGYDETYDASMDVMLGHTWKVYYFHYSIEEDAIIEYKGSVISPAQASSMCPQGLLEEIEASGKTIDSIILRENGIININYSSRDDNGWIVYGNANYDTVNGEYISAWGDEELNWINSNFGGTYDISISGRNL